jgi:uncharacterized protein (TIGR01777 family)
MIRALITGGTGFLGKKLTRALAARGWLVTVLTRDVAGSQGKLPDTVRLAGWNPSAPGPWTEEIEGVDTVIHLAGEGLFDAPWTKDRLGELRSSRVNSTRRLAEVIAAAKKKPKLFISASAVGIYGMRKDDAVLDEDSALGQSDALSGICKAWEQAAVAAREAGVRVVHPRIGVVLGADGGALARMVPPFKWRVGGPLGDGKQWVSWVHWRDVVDAVCFVHEKESFSGPFDMTAPNPSTMEDLAKAIALVLNTKSRFHVPPFVLKMAVGDGAAEALLTGQRAVPKKLEQAGFEFKYPDLVPALEDLIGPK